MQFLQTFDLLCSARNGQDRRVSALRDSVSTGYSPTYTGGEEDKFFRRLGASPSLTRQPFFPAT
mgnify:CR=1 FL=1